MVVVGGGVNVAVVAVDNVGGHIAVDDAGHGLDADKATNEAAHHKEAGCLVAPPSCLEIVFSLRQHVEQRREELWLG